MGFDPLMVEGGRGLLLKGIRDAQAVKVVIAQCARVVAADLPAAVGTAVAAIGVGTTAAGQATVPVSLDYDEVDAWVTANGQIGETLVGRFSCWQNSDVMLRLHFARQAFRFSGMYKNTLIINAMKESDAWQTTRMGLAIYFDLLRIGMTGKRLSDLTTLAGEASMGAVGAKFLTVAAGGRSPDTVSPSGLGVMQALVDAVEDAFAIPRLVRKKMTDRLPPPQYGQAQHGGAWIHRACLTCVVSPPSPPSPPPPPPPPPPI